MRFKNMLKSVSLVVALAMGACAGNQAYAATVTTMIATASGSPQVITYTAPAPVLVTISGAFPSGAQLYVNGVALFTGTGWQTVTFAMSTGQVLTLNEPAYGANFIVSAQSSL